MNPVTVVFLNSLFLGMGNHKRKLVLCQEKKKSKLIILVEKVLEICTILAQNQQEDKLKEFKVYIFIVELWFYGQVSYNACFDPN